MRASLRILSFLVVFGSSAFADSISLIATPDPSTTLPGLPVMVCLDVHNTGERDFHLPPRFSIEVVDESASRFFVRYGRTDDVTFGLPSYYVHSLVIPAGGHARFQIPLGGQITLGAFVSDSRTWKPGTYTIRLVFPEAENRRFESSRALVVVEEPTGDEARVWEFILDATKGRGLGADIATAPQIGRELSITTVSPNRYWPYVAMWADPPDEEASAAYLNRLMAEVPSDHPVASVLRVENAQSRLRRALRKAEATGMDDYLRSEIVSAYSDLESISATSPYDSSRASASEALARVSVDRNVEMLLLEKKPAVRP